MRLFNCTFPSPHSFPCLQKQLQSLNPTTNADNDDNNDNDNDTVARRVISCAMSAFGLCVFVVLSAMLVVLDMVQAAQAASLVACMLSLSVVWSRPVRQHTLCAHTSSMATRQNVTLLLGVVRVVSVVGFTLLTAAMGGEEDGVRDLSQAPGFVWSGVRELGENSGLVWGLVLHCLANLAACLLTRLGAFYTATRSALVIPSVVSTLVTSALFLLHCTDVVDVDVLGLPSCSLSHSGVAVLVVAVFLWVIPFMALRSQYLQPSDVLFRPEMESFLSISYSSVCFDQNLFLNYSPFSVLFGDCLMVGARRSRVFMCTTMYREADYEMEQLLRSLSKVSSSSRLKKANVYLESHIFLDNGADGFTLKEFALQLLSLVETCLSVARAESVIHKTPYGIQITCVLPGGMPLFLHLKDPSLVKAKKRWSQVMYMKYILDHRIKVTAAQTPIPVSDSVCVTINDTEDKNSEILVQIRSLLKGLKTDGGKKTATATATTTTLDIPDPSSDGGRDISEQSSDQGIDVGDEVSTISDSSSHKEHSPKPTSDNDNNNGTTPGHSSSSSSLKASSSYDSLLTSHLLHGKLNPAYIPDDGEELPSRWLPEFIRRMSGAGPLSDHLQALAGGATPCDALTGGATPCDPLTGGATPCDPLNSGASPCDGPAQPVIFSISDGVSEVEPEAYTSPLPLERPQVGDVIVFVSFRLPCFMSSHQEHRQQCQGKC